MGDDISMHMRCIGAIIDYFQWQKVTVIYEDRSSYTADSSIITLLSDVLQDIGAELECFSAFPVLSSLLDPKTTIQEELRKLMNKQSRVFIVAQASLSFTALLFEQAKQLGMMDKGHVWIISDGTTSLLDSVNSSLITSMEGILGFKAYFSDSTASFKTFKARFRRKFLSEYPDEEENPDPSIFALRAYDAFLAIGKATEKRTLTLSSLLSNILSSNFTGLSGVVHFRDNHRIMRIPAFRIVNVVGKSYREMGFWSPNFGFSKKLINHLDEKEESNASSEVLDSVFWSGGSFLVPTGLMKLSLSVSSGKPLRVMVPVNSNFSEYVTSSVTNTSHFSGLAIDIFNAIVERLPYSLAYEFIPFSDGSYDRMVEMVHQKYIDAAVGDIEITANRSRLVDFTQPYIDSALVMVVTIKTDKSQEAWVFMRPFTKGMWCLMAAMSVFTGFVVWLIEHKTNDEFNGSPVQQFGKVLWFSFTTLYLGQRDSHGNNLSRLVMVPWLFLILIVTASFTANLTSMIITSRLVPSSVEVGYLRSTNAAVGCDGGPLSLAYLQNVLGFKAENIRVMFSVDEYAEALTSGRIEAVFLLSPYAKILLVKYCKRFTLSGPSYNLGGFGFVFPKDSSLSSDLSEAIQNLTESGSLQQLEDQMLSLLNCSILETDSTGDQSLGPTPFSGLFILSGGVSVVALLIIIAGSLKAHFQRMNNFQVTLMETRIWRLAAMVLTKNGIRTAPTSTSQENSAQAAQQIDDNKALQLVKNIISNAIITSTTITTI
ncbi:glutamate receptor 2.9-like [Pistacia vera]|uniref:glutamate receptor 2.9-like n=1 Tax=Pistacia vera TaxID=55513 RepID=UPI001263373C|nr:glutamate receptor 2.9-like [Pistacia vera]